MDTLRHLERQHTVSGAGVFAGVGIAQADIISPFTYVRVLGSPSRDTVQIGESAHVELLPGLLQSVNHSCDPNVIFDVKEMVLRALREIDAGEELRYFYPATEWEMAEAFECQCGARCCLGLIDGASRMDFATLERYELAPHIQSLLARRIC